MATPPFLGLSGSTALTPTTYVMGSAGPGQAPSPWQVNGATIYYDQGGAILSSTVVGGTKGKGSINAAALYVNGVPVGLAGGGISLAAGTGIVLTPNPIVSSGTIAINPTYIAGELDDYLPLTGGTLVGALIGTTADFQLYKFDPGTAAAPTIAAESQAGTGLWSRIAGTLSVSTMGINNWEFTGAALRQAATGAISWSSTAAASGALDTTLTRDAAGVLAQRNSTAPQMLRVYNTYTDAANYERLVMGWTGNVGYIMQEVLGTGVARNVRIGGAAPFANLTIDNTSGLISVQRDGSSAATIFQIASTGLTSTALLHTRLTPTVNQASGTYTVLDVNPTQLTIGAGPHYLIRGRIGVAPNVFSVDNTGLTIIATPLAAAAGTEAVTAAWIRANWAPIASPSFSGDPHSITPPTADNDTSIATTAFVKNQGYLTTALAGTTYLPLAGGTLTGNLNGTTASFSSNVSAQDVTISRNFLVSGAGSSARAPTEPGSETSTKIATTAWVRSLFATRGQGDAVYIYNGAVVTGDPTAGRFIIEPITGNERRFAFSTTDADGVIRYLLLFQPGDSLIITNEFTPVSAYARYDLTGYPVDHTTWVEFTANYIDSKGIITPTVGARVKVTGYLNTATGDGPILGISAAYGLRYDPPGSAGNQGVVGLAVDNTLIAPLLNPTFTGDPKSVTPATANSTTSIATAAFVKAQGYMTITAANAAFQPLDVTLTALAGLTATPGLLEQTGTDTFAKRAMGVGATTSIPTRADADARYAAINHTHAMADVTGLTAALALKAALISPDFLGTPTAPTGTLGLNTTQLATCAFVQQEIAADIASYLPIGGGVLTGNLSTNGGYLMVDRTGDGITGQIIMRGDNNFAELVYFQTNTTNRWTIGKTATAESGTSTGSNFELVAYADAGTSIGPVFTANRASRVVDFPVSPTVPTIVPFTDNTTKVASTGFVVGKIALDLANYLPLGGGVLTGPLQGTTLGLGSPAVGGFSLRGAGQNTPNVSTSAGIGSTIYVQDTGAAVNNGGMIMFGATQGAFAALKGLIIDGANNTRGDLAISTRRVNTDATLTQTALFKSDGTTWLAGGLTGTTAAFTGYAYALGNMSAGDSPLNNVKMYLRGQTPATDYLIYGVNSVGQAKISVQDSGETTIDGRATITGNVGIGATATVKLDVQDTITGAVTMRLHNAQNAGTANFLQSIADRYVNRTITYSASYLHEIGVGIQTRFSDFDTHYFRPGNGGGWNFSIGNGGVSVGRDLPLQRLTVVGKTDTQGENIAAFYANNQSTGVGIGYDSVRKIGPTANADLYIDGIGTGRVALGYGCTGTTVIGRNPPAVSNSTEVATTNWVRTTALVLYSEHVTVPGQTIMQVNIPPSAKRVELEWVLAASDFGTRDLAIQVFAGGAWIGGTSYSTQLMVSNAAGNVVSGPGKYGVDYWWMGTVSGCKGTLRFSITPPYFILGEGTGWANSPGNRYSITYGCESNILSSSVSAFRMFFLGNPSLDAGNWLRVYVVI